MYVADAAFPRLRAFRFFSEKVFAANRNAPIVWIGEPSNAIEQRSLSRTRSAEQNRETGQRTEVDIQVEAAFRIQSVCECGLRVPKKSAEIVLWRRADSPPWTHRPWTPVQAIHDR